MLATVSIMAGINHHYRGRDDGGSGKGQSDLCSSSG